jgi:ABC-type tungstate transport system substrate-binding protein
MWGEETFIVVVRIVCLILHLLFSTQEGEGKIGLFFTTDYYELQGRTLLPLLNNVLISYYHSMLSNSQVVPSKKSILTIPNSVE